MGEHLPAKYEAPDLEPRTAEKAIKTQTTNKKLETVAYDDTELKQQHYIIFKMSNFALSSYHQNSISSGQLLAPTFL